GLHGVSLCSFPTRRSSDLKFRLLYLIAWYFLSSSLSIAQDRNQQVRELNQVMECMNQFSFCSLTWATDATQLQDAFQVSKKEIRSEEHTSELQSRENLVCR